MNISNNCFGNYANHPQIPLTLILAFYSQFLGKESDHNEQSEKKQNRHACYHHSSYDNFYQHVKKYPG